MYGLKVTSAGAWTSGRIASTRSIDEESKVTARNQAI